MDRRRIVFCHIFSSNEEQTVTRSMDTDLLDSLREKIYAVPRPPDSKYAINETLSQKISVTRDIPDTRPMECRSLTYNISELPTVR